MTHMYGPAAVRKRDFAGVTQYNFAELEIALSDKAKGAGNDAGVLLHRDRARSYVNAALDVFTEEESPYQHDLAIKLRDQLDGQGEESDAH